MCVLTPLRFVHGIKSNLDIFFIHAPAIDEVEAELFADEIQGLLSETPNTPQSPPQTPEAQKTRKTGKKDTSPGKSNAGTPKTPYKRGHSWADGCAGVVLQLLLDNGISRTSVNLGWEAIKVGEPPGASCFCIITDCHIFDSIPIIHHTQALK